MMRHVLAVCLVVGMSLLVAQQAPPGKRRFPGSLSPQTQAKMRSQELVDIMKMRNPFNRARSLWWYEFHGRRYGQRPWN